MVGRTLFISFKFSAWPRDRTKSRGRTCPTRSSSSWCWFRAPVPDPRRWSSCRSDSGRSIPWLDRRTPETRSAFTKSSERAPQESINCSITGSGLAVSSLCHNKYAGGVELSTRFGGWRVCLVRSVFCFFLLVRWQHCVTFLLVEEMSAAARHRRRHSFVKLGTGGDFLRRGRWSIGDRQLGSGRCTCCTSRFDLRSRALIFCERFVARFFFPIPPREINLVFAASN